LKYPTVPPLKKERHVMPRDEIGLKACIGAALDEVCRNGGEWVEGEEVFWKSLREDGMSIRQALTKALWVPQGIGKRDVTKGRNTFWAMFRSGREEKVDPNSVA
jgi:hypothetical protein